MHPPHLMVIGAALHLISQPQAGKAATLGKNPDDKAPDRTAKTATARTIPVSSSLINPLNPEASPERCRQAIGDFPMSA